METSEREYRDYKHERRIQRRMLKQEIRNMMDDIQKDHPEEEGENTIEQPLGEDGVHMDGFCDERNNFGRNKDAIIDIPGGEVADKSADRGSPNQFAGVPGPVDETEIELLFEGDEEEPKPDKPDSILDNE